MSTAESLVSKAVENVEPENELTMADRFHRLYYDNPQRTWLNTYWMGVPIAKCPLDLWVYQEIVYELRPDVIIECGTFLGGSALYLSSLCDLVDHGRVYTVDIGTVGEMPVHPRLEYLRGSSVGRQELEYLRSRIGPDETVLVILDSDHSKEHVLAELEAYSQFVTPGSYLILEDTNINGHPVFETFGPGPMEALEEFLPSHPELEIDHEREKFYVSFNPRGYLRLLVRPDGQELSAGRASRRRANPEALAHDSVAPPSVLKRGQDSAWTRALRIIGEGKRVLELGSAEGAMLCTELKIQDCSVTMIEPHPEAAARAAGFCDRVIVEDLEDSGWERQLGNERFDVIVAIDALEQQRDPAGTLRRLRRFLRPDGQIVASLRNVAHGAVRLSLLGGAFDAADNPGASSAEPLRFFTRRSAEDLFDRGDFAIRSVERIYRPVEPGAAQLAESSVPEALVRWLSIDEDSTTHQYLVVASPLRHGSERVLRNRVRELIEENDQLRQELRIVASSDAHGTPLSSDARAAVLDMKRQIARRDALFEQVQAQMLSALANAEPLRESVKEVEDRLRDVHDAALKSAEESQRYLESLKEALDAKELELRRTQAELASMYDALATHDFEARRYVDSLLTMMAEKEEFIRAMGEEHRQASIQHAATEAEQRERLARAEYGLEVVRSSRLWRIGGLYWKARRAFGLQ